MNWKKLKEVMVFRDVCAIIESAAIESGQTLYRGSLAIMQPGLEPVTFLAAQRALFPDGFGSEDRVVAGLLDYLRKGLLEMADGLQKAKGGGS